MNKKQKLGRKDGFSKAKNLLERGKSDQGRRQKRKGITPFGRRGTMLAEHATEYEGRRTNVEKKCQD